MLEVDLFVGLTRVYMNLFAGGCTQWLYLSGHFESVALYCLLTCLVAIVFLPTLEHQGSVPWRIALPPDRSFHFRGGGVPLLPGAPGGQCGCLCGCALATCWAALV